MRLLRMPFGADDPRRSRRPSRRRICTTRVAWVWTHAFGFGEFGVRSLSALAGIATVPVVYLAARWLGRPPRGSDRRAAGRGLAGDGVVLAGGSRLRAGDAAVGADRVVRRRLLRASRRRTWLVGWAASAALGLATPLLRRVRRARRARLAVADGRRVIAGWLAAVGLVAVVGCALVPLAITQQQTGHADYISHSSLAHDARADPQAAAARLREPRSASDRGAGGAAGAGRRGDAAGAVGAGARAGRVAAGRRGRRRCWCRSCWRSCGIDFLDTRNLLPALPPLVIAAGDRVRRLARAGARSAVAAQPRSTGVVAAVALALVAGARDRAGRRQPALSAR